MRYLVLVSTLLIVLVPPAEGASELEQETLRGLDGVRVLVETMSDEERRCGADRSRITTDVELRLRAAAIKVKDPKTGPALYVRINVGENKRRDGSVRGYYGNVTVKFNQTVVLARDRSIWSYGATTWSAGGVAIGPDCSVFREMLRDSIDEFANDFLKMNPKK